MVDRQHPLGEHMEQIGVVGTGTMGAGIAEVAARSGATVHLYAVDQAAMDVGLTHIQQSLQRVVERGKLNADDMQATIARIQPTLDLSSFAQCGLIIEAIPEVLRLKQQLFQTLGAVCSEQALLASNTSSLSITEIAAAASHPERVVGIHFFNPVPVMQLVEIIRGQASSERNVRQAQAVAQRFGKQSVVANDTPGFIVNRVARPFYLEALRLVGDGYADIPTVDAVVRELGFRMGPFELMDFIGLDVNFAVSASLYQQTYQEPRFRPHLLQEMLVRSGCLGRKSGRGFYDYAADAPKAVVMSAAKVDPPSGPWQEWATDLRVGFIIGRILSTLMNEAFWTVGQAVATRQDVDLAMQLGTNWPVGPFAWASQRGADLVLRTLAALREAHGDGYLPAPLLRQELASNAK
jgi:3-hydroxybutyryl-CoA dehydrogenase